MMTDVLPLGMSLVVLQALCKIEIDIPESMDENDDTDRTNDYIRSRKQGDTDGTFNIMLPCPNS